MVLAITEDGLSSDVVRGENAGRKLKHSAVVRKLVAVGRIDPRKAASFTAKPVVQIEPGWNQENLRAVVFVEERAIRRMLGAAAVPVVPLQ